MHILRAHVYYAFKVHIFVDFVSTGQIFYKFVYEAVCDDCVISIISLSIKSQFPEIQLVCLWDQSHQ